MALPGFEPFWRLPNSRKLALTLGVRLLLLPLQVWQQWSGRQTEALQDEAKAIQDGYTGEEQQKRLAELYARSGGRMLAGCLPALAHVLPLLAVLTSVWQTWATVPREQRLTMTLIPVLFSFFLIKASAAVVLYWAASNLISLAQHYLFAAARRPATA